MPTRRSILPVALVFLLPSLATAAPAGEAPPAWLEKECPTASWARSAGAREEWLVYTERGGEEAAAGGSHCRSKEPLALFRVTEGKKSRQWKRIWSSLGSDKQARLVATSDVVYGKLESIGPLPANPVRRCESKEGKLFCR